MKEEKVFATSGKKKSQCSKGDQCSFRHERNDRAQKPTPNAATPSEPSMTRDRSESRKRSVRGRGQTGRILRQPCRYYLKGTCTRSPCEYWHPPECQVYKTESVDKCLFPHFQVEEQPGKKLKKSFKNPQNGRKRQDAAASVKPVPQGWVSQDSEPSGLLKKRGVSGKPEAYSFGINPMSTIHTVYATSSKYPRK